MARPPDGRLGSLLLAAVEPGDHTEMRTSTPGSLIPPLALISVTMPFVLRRRLTTTSPRTIAITISPESVFLRLMKAMSPSSKTLHAIATHAHGIT